MFLRVGNDAGVAVQFARGASRGSSQETSQGALCKGLFTSEKAKPVWCRLLQYHQTLATRSAAHHVAKSLRGSVDTLIDLGKGLQSAGAQP